MGLSLLPNRNFCPLVRYICKLCVIPLSKLFICLTNGSDSSSLGGAAS